jgi:hypothetical protein
MIHMFIFGRIRIICACFYLQMTLISLMNCSSLSGIICTYILMMLHFKAMHIMKVIDKSHNGMIFLEKRIYFKPLHRPMHVAVRYYKPHLSDW